MRIGVVADDVAETNEMRAVLFLRILENGFGRFEIGVDVTENGEAHSLMSGRVLGRECVPASGMLSFVSRYFSRVIKVGSRSFSPAR